MLCGKLKSYKVAYSIQPYQQARFRPSRLTWSNSLHEG